MKTTIAPLLLVAATFIATGEPADDNTPTPTEEAWNQMQAFVRQPPDAMDMHLKDHGLKGHNFEPLRLYAKQADKDKTEAGEKLRLQMCAHREKYENDSEATAKFFDKWEAQEQRYMKKAVDDLPKLLSEADAAAFNALVKEHIDKKSSGEIHTLQNNAELVRMNPSITSEMVEDTCKVMP